MRLPSEFEELLHLEYLDPRDHDGPKRAASVGREPPTWARMVCTATRSWTVAITQGGPHSGETGGRPRLICPTGLADYEVVELQRHWTTCDHAANVRPFRLVSGVLGAIEAGVFYSIVGWKRKGCVFRSKRWASK